MQDVELLQSFLTESLEMLDEAEPKIIEIQRASEETGLVDQEALNAVFRLFHSIKGSAGFLQFSNVCAVTHEAETLLDLFRKGKAAVRPEYTQVMCRACDTIRQMLTRIEETQSDQGLETETQQMVDILTDAINTAQQSASGGKPAPTAAQPPPPPPPMDEEAAKVAALLMEDEPVAEIPAPAAPSPESLPSPPPPAPVAAPAPVVPSAPQTQVAPEMAQIFVQDADEVLETAEHGLMELEDSSANPEEQVAAVLRAFHTFKGNCGLMGLADLEKLSHKIETVLQGVRDKTVPISPPLIRLLLKLVDVERRTVSAFATGKSPALPGLPGMLDLLGEFMAPPAAAPGPAPVVEEAPSAGKARTVAAPPPAPAAPKPEPRIAPPTAPPPPAAKAPVPAAADESARQLEKVLGTTEAHPGQAALSRRDIRVNVEKLDHLTNLVGELVIAEAMVIHNSDLAGLRLDNFERQAHQLHRITNDLQDIAMSLRMVPVESTFRKMIRLVHDLAAKAGKKVDLKLLGEDTEVDRTVAEMISDPLVHMVRNSVDHGIEMPADRLKAGKPETGNVVIEARYQAGEVWIVITDDGRGLNREKIFAKAVERGLVERDANMREEDVYSLIFLPGFSTADKITDVSGRGVGMDVVRKNIEKIRGRIEIVNNPGKGTRFTLRIPLTLAIIQGMLVSVAQERYIIPLLSIRESMRADASMVSTVIGRGEMVNIRGGLLPLFRLARLFNTAGAIEEITQAIIVVVEDAGQQAAIMVDDLLGQQQTVIKSLGDVFGNIKGVSGASILSDGRIGLILDIEGIVKLAHSI